MSSSPPERFRLKNGHLIIFAVALGTAIFFIMQWKKQGRLTWIDFVGVGFSILVAALATLIMNRKRPR